jgi:Ser/Thr protein kinase RdoA (MazF antagonist)
MSDPAGVAAMALTRYRLPATATAELITVSENATYRVTDPAGSVRAVLRVHRLGYHPPGAIESELAWLDALREEAGVRTPRVLPARDGTRVLTVDDPDGGPPRDCVLFELLPGHEPATDRLTADFEPLGALTARMHRHARGWRRPPWFVRFHWNDDAAFGAGTPDTPAGRWGRWRDGVGVGTAEAEILGRLERTLRARLAGFGTGPARYGLIHADLRLANLLVDGPGDVSVIDFDDCGFGWYLYDLGAALSFIEHLPEVPEVVDAWVRGYRTQAELPAADVAEIPTFILLRRLLLVAWIGSHSDVEFASELGAGYTAGSCDLAEAYLRTHG